MNNFWKITAQADDTAELELSGEICMERPFDWWTGEKMDGYFIAFDEFKEGLKALKGKKNITIKLNSFGGDLFAGKSIYDELKALKANKTVQIMGVSASASTIIMLAGDKVIANTGDLIMIHEAKCTVIDNLDAEQAQRVVNTLTACNKAMAEIYAQKTGKGTQEILNAMHKETWFTAEQAKDFGLIDEVIDSKEQMKLSASADGKLFVGTNLFNLQGMKVPENIKKLLPQMEEQKTNSTAKTDEDIITAKGATTMAETVEKIETVEKLETTYPNLVKAIRENAVKAEQKRIQEIEEIEKSLILEKEQIANAKFGNEPMNARDLAFMNAQAQAKIGEAELGKLKNDAQNSNANTVTATGNDGVNNNAKPMSKDQVAFNNVVAELDKEFLM